MLGVHREHLALLVERHLEHRVLLRLRDAELLEQPREAAVDLVVAERERDVVELHNLPGAADGDVTDTFRPSPSPDDAAFDIREKVPDFDSCRDCGVVLPLLDASDVFRSASPGSGAVDACRARAWPPRRMRSTHAAHAASVGAQYTFLACDVSIVK